MNERDLPLPPRSLAVRVGPLPDEDPYREQPALEWQRSFREMGRRLANTVRATLPGDWSFSGRRVLDFGCGAGRVLRHFAAEAQVADWLACDIDERSIAWLTEHLCPPFKPFVSGALPPLPLDDASVDLIYVLSVYTHLTDSWSAWMAEQHRVLRPGGYMWVSFNGPGFAREHGDIAKDDGGIAFRAEDTDWDDFGPVTAHTLEWIADHWGRAFEIVSMLPDGLGGEAGSGQGFALMRRRDVEITAADLER